jgi:ribulose 1,5-bisphosphate carboxylase large subunit-like protein
MLHRLFPWIGWRLLDSKCLLLHVIQLFPVLALGVHPIVIPECILGHDHLLVFVGYISAYHPNLCNATKICAMQQFLF